MKTLRFLTPLLACLPLTIAHAANDPAPAPASAAAAQPDNATVKIHRTKPIQYPLPLLRDGITHGEARVLLNIDAEGRLVETMVLGYTHKPFADATLAALSEWRYDPARQNGEAVGTVADIVFRFEVNGILLVERVGVPQFTQTETFEPSYVYRPHGLSTLDGIPTPLHVTQPIYPKEWVDQGMRGNVTVDFYIDETGAVRMPAIAKTDHPYLAAAAVAAVREWSFAPPLRKGRPVLAHCQQVFRFEPSVATP